MPEQTNKEMLMILSVKIDSLTEGNLKIAKEQLQLACDFSTYVNKSELKFTEILGYLESNSKTNTKGAIEQIKENKENIFVLDTKFNTSQKVEKAKRTVLGAIVGAVGTFLVKFLF